MTSKFQDLFDSIPPGDDRDAKSTFTPRAHADFQGGGTPHTLRLKVSAEALIIQPNVRITRWVDMPILLNSTYNYLINAVTQIGFHCAPLYFTPSTPTSRKDTYEGTEGKDKTLVVSHSDTGLSKRGTLG